jgi:hypothetical protein
MLQTPEEEAAMLCPLARTFATPKAEAGCRGPACMCWRWEKVGVSNPLWLPAVRKVAEEIGDTTPNRAKAAKVVADDMEAYGLVPTKGFCGIGGA